MTAAATRTTIHPSLRYRKAPEAIEWLCEVLGFTRHLVVPDSAGGIAHAQLALGNGLIMLGSARDDDWGRRMAMPDEIGGRQTQSCYLTIADAELDAHYARVVDAGTEIIDPLTPRDYGGKGYACRDPEGHIWSIGSYDPWA